KCRFGNLISSDELQETLASIVPVRATVERIGYRRTAIGYRLTRIPYREHLFAPVSSFFSDPTPLARSLQSRYLYSAFLCYADRAHVFGNFASLLDLSAVVV